MVAGRRLWFVVGLLLMSMAVTAGAAWQGNRQLGDSGEAVWEINRRLCLLGYNVNPDQQVYDQMTANAVRTFQRQAGLPATGLVDELTYARLLDPAGRGRRAVHDRQPDAGSRVVTTAIQYIGVPYLFGGFTPDAFDCSGFVQYVFARLGVDLPRTADYQFECGLPVAKSALRPGDVVFFTTYEPGASHDGIYVGDGMFIAATVSRGVAYCDLNDPFWTGCYLGARRYL